MRRPPDNEKRRPWAEAASETSRRTKVTFDSTASPLSTSCTSNCSDCHGTGAVGLRPCDRRTHWLRRVGYADLFGRWAA